LASAGRTRQNGACSPIVVRAPVRHADVPQERTEIEVQLSARRVVRVVAASLRRFLATVENRGTRCNQRVANPNVWRGLSHQQSACSPDRCRGFQILSSALPHRWSRTTAQRSADGSTGQRHCVRVTLCSNRIWRNQRARERRHSSRRVSVKPQV
jgi:hypothetical protein